MVDREPESVIGELVYGRFVDGRFVEDGAAPDAPAGPASNAPPPPPPAAVDAARCLRDAMHLLERANAASQAYLQAWQAVLTPTGAPRR